MKKVTQIGGKAAAINKEKKLRVAAYCRVSTDSDAQLVTAAQLPAKSGCTEVPLQAIHLNAPRMGAGRHLL